MFVEARESQHRVRWLVVEFITKGDSWGQDSVGPGVRFMALGIPSVPLTNYVSPCKSLNLSGPQFFFSIKWVNSHGMEL